MQMATRIERFALGNNATTVRVVVPESLSKALEAKGYRADVTGPAKPNEGRAFEKLLSDTAKAPRKRASTAGAVVIQASSSRR